MYFLNALTLSIILFPTSEQVPIAEAVEEQPIVIPLKSIWAWDMPGTKDVRDLDANREKYEKMSATDQIKKSLAMNTRWRLNLNHKPKNNKKAGLGFVVAATGFKALKEANSILAETKDRKEKFVEGGELTLFFYAYGSSRYVRIDEVVKEKNKIIVRYHFDSHGHRKTTQHYALIPLGNDLTGNVKVTIERQEDTFDAAWHPQQPPPYTIKEARQLVCESFGFIVVPPPE